jgi:hypothetical protein
MLSGTEAGHSKTPGLATGGSLHTFFLCLLAFCRLRYLCFDIFLRRFLISEPNSNLKLCVATKRPRDLPDGRRTYRFANRHGKRKPDAS